MKAAVLRRRGGPEVLALADVPAPRVAGPRDVLVRVRAAGVNPVDAYLRAGLVPVPLRYPWVLGGDAAGTVEAVGPAVTRFAPGQRVFGMLDYVRRPGCYAELALFRDDELAPAPPALGDAALAALPLVSLTAWLALVDAGRLGRGGRVLVHGGAGGIGSVAVPIAKARGAREVVVTASAASAAACLTRGADRVLDRADPDAFRAPDLGRFDVILDAVGGYYPRTVGLLAPGGTFVTITSLADDDAYTFGNFVRHLGRLVWTRLAGAFGGPRVRSVGVRPNAGHLRAIADLIERGALPPPEVEALPLAAAAEAHRRIETRRTRGKLVLVP